MTRKRKRKPHVHTVRCLDVSTWDASACPSIGYADWVRLAKDAVDQDQAWRFHETQHRENARSDFSDWIDVGGES